MEGATAGQLAVSLPWLAPSAAALAALTDDPPTVAPLAADTAMVVHIYRFARPTLGPGDDPFGSAILHQPALCSAAAELLAQQAPDRALESQPIRRVADLAARIAAQLAADSGDVRPSVAAAVAQLAFLGHSAVDCVSQIPEQAQDTASIGRRLAARWRLPEWLTATSGSLHLHPVDAIRMGAPDGLFQLVQAAVAAAERACGTPGLTIDTDTESKLFADAEQLARVLFEPVDSVISYPEEHRLPDAVWVKLLRATASARRANGSTWLSEAEERLDRATDALRLARQEQAVTLRDAKLTSLAEFAAGASHEINNPLAVIAGHAQLLLNGEPDADRRKQLSTILRQTTRVHDLLHGTLQFARPHRPTPDRFDLGLWLREAVESVRPDAERKQVTVEIEPTDTAVVLADPGQARQAITQLLLNGLQAAATGGWVRVSAAVAAGRATVSVVDSGAGPDQDHTPHLFDPFFSGRSAGRGRGLGLSIAWRLARINGGSVDYKPSPGRPTRFTLMLPVTCDGFAITSERRSA